MVSDTLTSCTSLLLFPRPPFSHLLYSSVLHVHRGHDIRATVCRSLIQTISLYFFSGLPHLKFILFFICTVIKLISNAASLVISTTSFLLTLLVLSLILKNFDQLKYFFSLSNQIYYIHEGIQRINVRYHCPVLSLICQHWL